VAINKNKINDNALKYIQKGQVKKAIREYEKILGEDPNDVRTLLKKGDLLVRVGEKGQAVDTYLRVAGSYSQQGFHLKAVAVFKQILKIDDSRIDVNLRLADEYQNLGIVGDAMSHLQVVAAHYDQQGMTRESLDILRRIVDLDPDNIASRIKLAELYSREGMSEEAVEEFNRAAEDLKGANRVEDYIKVAERLVYHDGSNIALVKELANIYLQRGDTKRALGKLQVCFKSDPRDIETLSMLAMAFQELNQLSKTVSVYKEMAKIYQEQGAVGEMQQVYRRVLEIAPDDPEANQVLSSGAPPPTAAPEMSADETMEQSLPQVTMPTGPTTEMPEMEPPEIQMEVPEYEEVEEVEEVEEAVEVSGIEDLQEPEYQTGLTVPEKPQQEYIADDQPAEAAAADPSREAVSRLLTETDVYIKYGLQNKALEHLNRIFQLDPNNIEAHEKLKDLYLAADEMEHAAQELLTLARLVSQHGQTEQARSYIRSLLTIFPGHNEGMAFARELEGEAPVAAAEEAVADDFSPAMDPDAPDVILMDSDATVEVGEFDASLDEDVPIDEVPIDVDEDLVVETDDEEAATMIADRPMMEAVEEAAATADNEHQMLDYGGTEETVDANVLTTGVYPPGGADDYIESAPDSGQTAIPESLDEPEVLELVDEEPEMLEAEPEEAEPLPLEEDVELIEFTDDEEFFEEDSAPAVAAPPPPPPPDEFSDSEMSTVVAEEGLPLEDLPQPAAEPAEEADEEELADALEEVDFFLQQNLLEEAQDELDRLKESYPEHPEVQERVAKLMQLQTGETPVAQVSAEELEESFDLAAEIESEVGDEGAPIPLDEDFQYSFDDVFSEFKKGVEKVVAKEDSSTHFDLGIAYKEMGLIDDAISEFTIASQDGGKKAAALTMVGLCLVEQGKYSDAINRFKDALHGPGISEQETTGVYYEMGRAYELLEDPAEALFYYKKVSKRDPKFRDVAARLKALGNKPDGGGGKPPKASKNKSKISYM
jgi:tetratricopeptide (TPR) repeat protein